MLIAMMIYIIYICISRKSNALTLTLLFVPVFLFGVCVIVFKLRREVVVQKSYDAMEYNDSCSGHIININMNIIMIIIIMIMIMIMIMIIIIIIIVTLLLLAAGPENTPTSFRPLC